MSVVDEQTCQIRAQPSRLHFVWATHLPFFTAPSLSYRAWVTRPIYSQMAWVMMTGMSLGQSFESVLDAAKVGADWAWAVLYGEIAGPVMGFFRSRGVADPEEAAGDVFFELARGLADFEGSEESFRTFVFVIAYRRLMTENRYSTRRSRTVLADQVLDRLQADVEVMGVVSAPEIPDEVRRAFALLTPDQRDVLTLRIVAGLSVDQVAEVLNRGVTTVKSLQRRGMGRLRSRSLQVDEAMLA